jgi:3'(2'),5'-bisphosphate nucleotidase
LEFHLLPELEFSKTLDLMIKAALAAGEVILKIYNQPISSTKKQDGSPVTIADEQAEKIILGILAQTNIPILAEESAAKGDIPELGNRFFIVDPLDGTKEFIKKNGEFTVNIALVENGKPICGIVTAPALSQGFIGSKNGAFSFPIIDSKAGSLTPIKSIDNGPIDIVASRSHGNSLLNKLQKKIQIGENLSVGSSLKFCLLASGKARIYPRFTPTCEWDTAAGQAVLEAAGGVVLTTDGKPLAYGKIAKKFYNPFFLAAGDLALGEEAAKKMATIE